MHTIIAMEFGILIPDDMPVYRFQQLAQFAQKQRQEKIDAAQAQAHQ